MGIAFTPLAAADLPTLAAWLGAPHVKRWWPDPDDLGSVAAKYGPIIDGSETTRGFIVTCDDVPIGFIQSYRFDDEPEWSATVGAVAAVDGAVGIDYLIGREDTIGLGRGSAAVAAFVATVWELYADSSVIVVAVQQDNVASWKALERAGFHRAWSGRLSTSDPSDQGPAHLYLRRREAT